MMIGKFLFWMSLFFVVYVYGGYYLALKVWAVWKGVQAKVREKQAIRGPLPLVSIIIAAYNEEDAITERIDNLLSLEYPRQKVEIVIVSDGSTDKTVGMARSCQFGNVKVLEFEEKRGRAAVHNDAAAIAAGQILVFTDAETKFDPQFLGNLILGFSDASVGCVVGNLVYETDGTAISRSEGFYWSFEKKLRKMESELGILATGTGACMAVRKDLWRDVQETDDIDFVTPLDIIQQGFGVVVAIDAVAYDVPPQSTESEFRARIRQTSRNLAGTLRLWTWRNWLKHPAVTWGLISHKLLRWMTPYFLLAFFLSNLFLYDDHWFYAVLLVGQILLYLLVVLGYFAEKVNLRIRVADTAFSFCVANMGMAIGILNAIAGKVPAAYRKAR